MTTTERPTAISTEEECGGIFRSIAALKQILNFDSPTRDILNDKNSMLQQLRYEEQKRFENQMKEQNEQMEELKSRIDALKKESEKERSLRKTLETTYEALSEHKKELTIQLEMISNSRDALEEKVAGAGSNLEALEKSHASEKKVVETKLEEVSKEKDDALEKTGNLEARLVTVEREVEARVKVMQLGLDGHVASSEILKKQLVASEEARTKATTELATVKAELEALKAAGLSNKSSLEGGPKDLDEKGELKEMQEKFEVEKIGRRSVAENLQKAALKIVQLGAQTREMEKRIHQSEEKGNAASEELATTQTSLQETQDKLKESQEKVERYQARIVELLDVIATSDVEKTTPTPKKRILADGQLAVVKEEETEDDGQNPNKKSRKLM